MRKAKKLFGDLRNAFFDFKSARKKNKTKIVSYNHRGINHPFRNDPINKSKRYKKRTGNFKMFS